MAVDQWRVWANMVGRRQRRSKTHGPRLSCPSGAERSFVSLLNEILATEELIKATGCATEPLCCCLASVTLESCLKGPLLRACSCFLHRPVFAKDRFTSISRTTWVLLPVSTPHGPNKLQRNSHRYEVKESIKKDGPGGLCAVLQLCWYLFLHLFDVKDHRDFFFPALEMCRPG